MKGYFSIIGVLCLIVAAFTLTGCGSSAAPVKSGSIPTSTTSEATAPVAKPLSLKIGDTTSYDGGLKVTVLSAGKGPKDYEGKATFKITVVYVNDGTDTASFGESDWKLQDSNGARSNDPAYFMKGYKTLGFGDLAPGGRKTGSMYFSGSKFVAVIFESNMFGGEEDLSSWSIK